ncbi:toxin-antitoxin system, antitoxin component [Halobacteriales archaeon QS_1_68_20]|nr:MAG: toxin-antitoxin system, antitoxin component [Halobacteriales archaeon QS_1_68_20]
MTTVEYELEKAREALEDARTLVREGSDAGAINRLYYACYHAAVAAVLDETGEMPNTHAAAVSAFGEFVVANYETVTTAHGSLFSQLKEEHEKADYGYQGFRKTPEEYEPGVEAFLETIESAIAE